MELGRLDRAYTQAGRYLADKVFDASYGAVRALRDLASKSGSPDDQVLDAVLLEFACALAAWTQSVASVELGPEAGTFVAGIMRAQLVVLLLDQFDVQWNARADTEAEWLQAMRDRVSAYGAFHCQCLVGLRRW